MKSDEDEGDEDEEEERTMDDDLSITSTEDSNHSLLSGNNVARVIFLLFAIVCRNTYKTISKKRN